MMSSSRSSDQQPATTRHDDDDEDESVNNESSTAAASLQDDHGFCTLTTTTIAVCLVTVLALTECFFGTLFESNALVMDAAATLVSTLCYFYYYSRKDIDEGNHAWWWKNNKVIDVLSILIVTALSLSLAVGAVLILLEMAKPDGGNPQAYYRNVYPVETMTRSMRVFSILWLLLDGGAALMVAVDERTIFGNSSIMLPAAVLKAHLELRRRGLCGPPSEVGQDEYILQQEGGDRRAPAIFINASCITSLGRSVCILLAALALSGIRADCVATLFVCSLVLGGMVAPQMIALRRGS